MLKPFKNIVLLLPDENKGTSLDIMNDRSKGDTRENERFLESPCNTELATFTVYGHNRQPSKIAEEIMQSIKQRKEKKIDLESIYQHSL